MKISEGANQTVRLTTDWDIETAKWRRRRVKWNKLNNPVITFHSLKSDECPGRKDGCVHGEFKASTLGIFHLSEGWMLSLVWIIS